MGKEDAAIVDNKSESYKPEVQKSEGAVENTADKPEDICFLILPFSFLFFRRFLNCVQLRFCVYFKGSFLSSGPSF